MMWKYRRFAQLVYALQYGKILPLFQPLQPAKKGTCTKMTHMIRRLRSSYRDYQIQYHNRKAIDDQKYIAQTESGCIAATFANSAL